MHRALARIPREKQRWGARPLARPLINNFKTFLAVARSARVLHRQAPLARSGKP